MREGPRTGSPAPPKKKLNVSKVLLEIHQILGTPVHGGRGLCLLLHRLGVDFIEPLHAQHNLLFHRNCVLAKILDRPQLHQFEIRRGLREGEGGGPGSVFGLFYLGFRALLATKGGGTPALGGVP